MEKLNRPLVRAVLFTLGEKSYAWIITETLDEWEFEPIGSSAERDSLEWAEAAFLACVRAFRRLQAHHPEMDIVIGTEKCPIGQELRRPFL
jgi:hypothetical protein